MSSAVTIHDLRFQCDACHEEFWKEVSQGRWEPDIFKS